MSGDGSDVATIPSFVLSTGTNAMRARIMAITDPFKSFTDRVTVSSTSPGKLSERFGVLWQRKESEP
jgi:hypothetical protein